MTGQLTVRDVPEDVIRALRKRAKESGRSMNAIARAALEEYAKREAWQERLREQLPKIDALREEIRQAHGGDLSDSTELIREDRDR